MSVYNVVIMTLITASLSFVVGRGNIDAKYALYSTAFNVVSTFTVLFLFVPKVSGNTHYVVNGLTQQS